MDQQGGFFFWRWLVTPKLFGEFNTDLLTDNLPAGGFANLA